MELILTTPEDLAKAVKKSLVEHDEDKKKNEIPKLYSINQVAKMLGKSYNTIKKYIDQGLLKTTVNGLITEHSINEFLGNQ